MPLATSVLIPSFRRPERVTRCLESLGSQTTLPDEVIVVWQGDDAATRDAVERLQSNLPYQLRMLHSADVGVVPAENTALNSASGDILLLIDDDATAPEDWVERHLHHYADPTVGAVGGPADNFLPDGNAYPRHPAEPQGRLTWYGKTIGNMHDQPETWRTRQPTEVHHLVGYNLSVRRSAVKIFEAGLRPYWQLFELDACLQVRAGGYRVLFDYGIVVQHYPTNPAYAGGREGDLQIKVLNAAYNHGFVLAKWSPWFLRLPRLGYCLAVGSVGQPGFLGFIAAVMRYGRPLAELRLLAQTWRARVEGWAAGSRVRRAALLS